MMRTPKDHQLSALKAAIDHYRDHDRGQLIMACGTGKTYTALLILEAIVPDNGHVLYLAPSINLLSQTLQEFNSQATDQNTYLVVCSDEHSHRSAEDGRVADLPIPPTTDPQLIANALIDNPASKTIVVCTYQSLGEIRLAQQQGAPDFDLIICDEAHRTAGVAHDEKQGKYFTSINDKEFVRGTKRLYMTATPISYSQSSKRQAEDDQVLLWSMDDETLFGKVFFKLGLDQAVEQGLATDYKVVIPVISQRWAAEKIQPYLTYLPKDSKVTINEAAIIMGCYKVLKDYDIKHAIAFVNTIKKSKDYTDGFNKLVDRCVEVVDNDPDQFRVATRHIDGTMNAVQKKELLTWLQNE